MAPSTEVLAERVGIDPRSIVRFDGNVAAAPPPSARPAALARALADINEYDRGRYLPLREAIARYHDLGHRSRRARAPAATSSSSCSRDSSLRAGRSRRCPRTRTRCIDTRLSWPEPRWSRIPTKADLVFVCRPNNPTGELCDIPEVNGQLVIDEAYADYAGVDALDRLDDGVIILRTFSKAFGLAGARVGYALAMPELVEVISSRQAPLSVSSLSAALALTAIAPEARRLGDDRRARATRA